MKHLALALSLLSMTGCSPPENRSLEIESPVDRARLEDRDWQLRAYLDEAGILSPVLPEAPIDLRFGADDVTGSGGCNRYSGRYTLGEGDRLAFDSELATTRMACAEVIARQEQRYLGLLPLVASWRRSGDSLWLLDREGLRTLEFAAVRPARLTDAEWQATGINNGHGGVVSGPTTSRATATFSDGQVTGNAGCNRFTASFELDDDQITIGPAGTTRMLCPEPAGVMEQEQQYLEALSRTRSYRLTPDRLELRDASGGLQVAYRLRDD